MKKEYPCLNYIMASAECLLKTSESIKVDPKYFDFHITIFKQIWGNTAGGLDDGGFSGQAMTSMYTTVVHERTSDTYVVFFDNTMTYKVTNATDVFKKDLAERNLKSLGDAKKYY